MLRFLGRNFIFNTKVPTLFSSVKNVRLIALTQKQNFSNIQEGSSNANESSDRDPEKVKRAKLLDVLIVSSIGIIGFGYLIVRRAFSQPVQAKSAGGLVQELGGGSETAIGTDGEGAKTQVQRKKRKTFKETKIIGYEDRIRAYSTPDKIFRYFATIQSGHLGTGEMEIYMTPQDFVRSLTPGIIQPEGLGLDRFKQLDKNKDVYNGYTHDDGSPGDSVLKNLGCNGLINFSDYLFLLTVLGTPPRHISIAFKMFDLNGDGDVSADEFDKMQSVLLSLTSTGMRHRDRTTTGNVLGSRVNSGLKLYFFGPQCTQKLTAQRFIEFQQKLQKEVLFLEFQFYEPVDGKITEVEFADMLLTYSSFTSKKKERTLKRIKKTFKENSQGVTFKDYVDFFSFLRNIGDVDTALSFHTACGSDLNPETFKRVAHLVSGVRLQDHIVDVVFKMFDENDDGELSSKEFVSVMKTNLMRGLDKPKDTGFTKLISAISKCAKQSVKEQLFHK
ncbi:calcium uptake protein 1, mitochondrial-like [Dendronephthya gigantea]|uniref:calcium uptake protein 1, mitochondrial-like n=1 Tax=Dendronephthya gigantea TaxID=151771 RepID=UPI00106C3864|nr:calcium uptake protein 1, mitochondrial-like [Dendronephthya gigantea]